MILNINGYKCNHRPPLQLFATLPAVIILTMLYFYLLCFPRINLFIHTNFRCFCCFCQTNTTHQQCSLCIYLLCNMMLCMQTDNWHLDRDCLFYFLSISWSTVIISSWFLIFNSNKIIFSVEHQTSFNCKYMLIVNLVPVRHYKQVGTGENKTLIKQLILTFHRERRWSVPGESVMIDFESSEVFMTQEWGRGSTVSCSEQHFSTCQCKQFGNCVEHSP